MRLLELFCGTGSIGRAFGKQGFEVTSVDIDKKTKATHTCDILDFDYRQYPVGHFHVVWASPPCTMYSRARTTGGPRDLEGADRLVQKTLEIIDYYKPLLWAFENVGSGLLPKREVVQGLHCSFLTYCKYADADFPKYRKLTAVWHNLPWTPRPVCCKASPCPHVVDGRHPCSAQRGPTRSRFISPTNDRFTLHTLYSMPPALCEELGQICWHACQDASRDDGELAREPFHAGPRLDPVAV
jgi:hypothetical protein